MTEANYRFDGKMFALSWLTVASAASDDPERIALYRSVNVELDEGGVRLTSTDSYRFWAQWVGEKPSTKEPDYEAPRADSVIVVDEEFRARDLMKYVARATRKEDAPALTITLGIGSSPREEGQFDGMETGAATFTVSDTLTGQLHESLLLPLIDIGYPDLRLIYNDHDPAPADEVSFNPVLLNKMMRAVPGSEEMPCRLVFAGPTGAALIVPYGSEEGWVLRGAPMPVNTSKAREA